MTIDWTQPCETTEDPPRPVRVLCNGGDVEACILGGELWWIDPSNELCWRQGDNDDGDYVNITLRNVAPPKPEPVLIERWATVWGDGAFYGPFKSRPLAELRGSQVIRLAWMSDGSPVPASPAQFDHMREMAKMIQERDEWKANAEEALSLLRMANDRVEALQDEVACMKPVVDAAVSGVDSFNRCGLLRLIEAVANAVEMMGPPRNLPTADALRNWRMTSDEPVRNCTTCRFGPRASAKCMGGICFSYSGREPRHD